MQVGVWFTYGCAALDCEEFSLAATAFRRCVNLDNDVCLLCILHCFLVQISSEEFSTLHLVLHGAVCVLCSGSATSAVMMDVSHINLCYPVPLHFILHTNVGTSAGFPQTWKTWNCQGIL